MGSPFVAARSTNGMTATEARRGAVAIRRRCSRARRRRSRVETTEEAAAASLGAEPPACALAVRHASRMGVLSRPFRLEQPDRRRQVLLSLANPAAAGQTRSEGSRGRADRTAPARATSPDSRTPRLAGHTPGQALQQGRRGSRGNRRRWAMSQPLNCGLRSISSRRESRRRTAQHSAPQPLRGEAVDALLGRARDLDRIDEAVREVEPDGVAAGSRPAADPARRRCP